MIGLDVRITGVEKIDRGIRIMSNGLKDRTVLHKRMGRVGVRWIQQNFQRQGQPRWKRLSPNTVAARRKGSSKILQDSGLLRASFDSQANSVRAVIGSPLQISLYHEKGTKKYVIKPKKSGGSLRFVTAGGVVFAKSVQHPGVSKRKMLPTEKQAAKEIVIPVTQQYIDELIRKSGLF